MEFPATPRNTPYTCIFSNLKHLTCPDVFDTFPEIEPASPKWLPR